jgi:hypothetical protein
MIKLTGKNYLHMKKSVLWRGQVLALALFLLSAFGITSFLDLYETLQIEKSKAEELMSRSFASGKPQTVSDLTKTARGLEAELRVATVRELIRAARAYTESSAFQSDYTRWRDQQLGYDTKPTSAVRNPLGMLEKKLNKKVNEKKDEGKYPAKPADAVKLRLQEFLDLSATVDFSAKLTSTRRFENSEYEAKPNEWKACYRAGEPVVKAAREEVEKWLKEIQ